MLWSSRGSVLDHLGGVGPWRDMRTRDAGENEPQTRSPSQKHLRKTSDTCSLAFCTKSQKWWLDGVFVCGWQCAGHGCSCVMVGTWSYLSQGLYLWFVCESSRRHSMKVACITEKKSCHLVIAELQHGKALSGINGPESTTRDPKTTGETVCVLWIACYSV